MSEERTVLYQPNKIYHLINHANGNENLYEKEENYHYFLKAFVKRFEPLLETFAYCLMPNHFHFLVQIKSAKELHLFQQHKLKTHRKPPKNPLSIEAGEIYFDNIIFQELSNLTNSYTKAFNLYKKKGGKPRVGNLFVDATIPVLITGKKHFKTVLRYIDCNAIHHDFVNDAREWAYSSYHDYIYERESFLCKEKVLRCFKNLDDFVAFHNEYNNDDTINLE